MTELPAVTSAALTAELVVNATADTQIAQLLPNANAGSAATMQTAGAPFSGWMRSMVRIDDAALAAAVGKRTVTRAILELPIDGVSLNWSGKVGVHRMLMPWSESKATWQCANADTPNFWWSSCPTGSAWNMNPLSPTHPYVEVPTGSATLTLFQAGYASFDVTADVQAFARGDANNFGWLIREGQQFLPVWAAFKTRETSAKPRLRLIVEDAEDDNEDALRDFVDGMPDDAQRRVTGAIALATLCLLSRVARGDSTSELDSKLGSLLAGLPPETMDSLRRGGDAATSLPPDLLADLLGPAAADFNPEACANAPEQMLMDFVTKALPGAPTPHLRGPLCGGTAYAGDVEPDVGARAITVSSSALRQPDGLDDILVGKLGTTARPVIIGVDPVDGINGSLRADDELGHASLVENWRAFRREGGASPTNQAIGDGLSPWGVDTGIPCAGGCPAEEGLLCASEAGLLGDNCLAFPRVARSGNENAFMTLRGVNFWDPQPKLRFTRVGNPALGGVVDAQGVFANENDHVLACVGPATLADPRLTVPNHNTVRFPVSVEPGFYRLSMYNMNGRYRAQHDQPTDPQRTIHVCYADSDLDQYESVGESTNTDCAVTARTCVQDAVDPTGLCEVETWSTPPRPLSECGEGQPVNQANPCGETPAHFESYEPTPAIVYVGPAKPAYTLRVQAQQVAAVDETAGWGSDELKLTALAMTPGVVMRTYNDPAAAAGLMQSYAADFDTGTVRTYTDSPRTLSTVLGATLGENVDVLVKFVEDDDPVLGTILAVAIITVIAATAIALGPQMVAAGVLAAGALGTYTAVAAFSGAAVITAAVIAGMALGEDDLIGFATYRGSVGGFTERINASHATDFLFPSEWDSAERFQHPPFEMQSGPFSALDPVDGGALRGSEVHFLIHPILNPLPKLCVAGGFGCFIQWQEIPDADCTPALPCSGQHDVCFAGRCVRSDPMNDPGGDLVAKVANRAFSQRVSIRGGGAHYISDLRFDRELCAGSCP